jgi:hypothetical protein
MDEHGVQLSHPAAKTGGNAPHLPEGLFSLTYHTAPVHYYGPLRRWWHVF